MSDRDRLGCRECGHFHFSDQRLLAKNPFDPERLVDGCPECRTVGEADHLCDEPDCPSLALQGTRHCHRHVR